MRWLGIALAVTLFPVAALAQAPVRTCESLSSLAVKGAAISGTVVPARGFSSAQTASPAPGVTNALPMCRVTAALRPSADSDIKIEVWLPLEGWNGKLQAVGNGAFNGSIAYPALAEALSRGYAAASTDTGHVGNTAAFALGHPEKLIDFGYRAVHEMTVAATALVNALYGSQPRYTYWNGCSAGGRQGLQAAQRYPRDFDGIIAGAPGLDWTGRAARAVQVLEAIEQNPAGTLTASERTLLHKAAVAACDASDGLVDGLIGQPDRCAFDPGTLQCSGSQASSCLSAAQVSTARLMYSSVLNPKTKREVPGVLPGSELGWTDQGWTASAQNTGVNVFRYIVYQDPQWNVRDFKIEADLPRAEEGDRNTMNALDPNLKPFIESGGKLIQYHGLSDPQISPSASIQYYETVVRTTGSAVTNSYRLFLAPGMGHCGGGEGPNTFDMMSALEAWVERGVIPTAVAASHEVNGRVDRTRPLCPYPEIATYKGSGSIDAAASFTCAARPQAGR